MCPSRVDEANSEDHGGSGNGRSSLAQQLFVTYSPQLRAYALALAGDFAAADDVVQEAFLTVTAKAADFQPGSNFLAWARAIVRHKVQENRRTSRRFSSAVLDSLAASATPDNFQEYRIDVVMNCMDELPPKARELVRLRYFCDHGPTEIADMLGRTINGVNNGLLKARNAIRDCVERKLAGGSEATVGGSV
jgi:RNA polymerase sigma-70 factor (ECF subfamily)